MLEPVVDDASHRRALERIEALWDAAPGTPEGDELDALATLVEVYEKRRTPILPPDPVEAIRIRLEQLGWTRKELEPLIGSRARVSEVLGRKRALTLPMIRRLQRAMAIPAEVLIAAGATGSPAGKGAGKRAGARPARRVRNDAPRPSGRAGSSARRGAR